ncbi:MAG: MBOAT family protein [Spirochaetaceae bacterium]|nr:MBOAT family protein [Spirochaetaceae bacterium]
MVFNSVEFLLFFPIAVIGYFILTMRLKSAFLSRLFLLALSLFFYGSWKPEYLALIILSVLVTWASGLLMEGQSRNRKRIVLAGSLVLNLGILFFFKYYGFFAETLRLLAPNAPAMPSFNVLLPVGISFYTFQALGYSIDVWYGRVRAERNLCTYALFVTFFPQLVAGPIERTGSLLPQFKTNHGFDYDRVTSGLKLAAWGMFKKVVIADRLALYVNGVYGEPAAYPAAALALATFFFAFQIYCDFSGYSDIAIGCARVLGFNLMTNFRQPYFAASIADFWRRWHISLSAWFKDYLYIPLGGSRRGAFRQKVSLLVTFLVSGLWHGAAWHFLAWGALHGILQIIERGHGPFLGLGLCPKVPSPRSPAGKEGRFKPIKITAHPFAKPLARKCAAFARICVTFTLVCCAWIFFRADSVGDAVVIFAKLSGLPANLIHLYRQLPALGIVGVVRAAFQLGNDAANPIDGFGVTAFGISALCILVLLVHDILSHNAPEERFVSARRPLLFRWAGYYALILAILLSWNIEASQFIYFTF